MSPKVMAIQQARIQKRLDEKKIIDVKRLAKKDAAVDRELEVHRLRATQAQEPEATGIVIPAGSQTTMIIGQVIDTTNTTTEAVTDTIIPIQVTKKRVIKYKCVGSFCDSVTCKSKELGWTFCLKCDKAVCAVPQCHEAMKSHISVCQASN